MIRKLRRGMLVSVLFVMGLLGGLVLFAPMEQVWSAALGTASSRMKNVEIRWGSVSDASLLGATVRNLEIATARRTVRARVLRVLGGYREPWLDAELGTGVERLNAVLRDTLLSLDGSVDLADMMGAAKASGILSVVGSVTFSEVPGGRPVKGAMTLDSPDLTLNEIMKLGNVRCEMSLDGDTLTISRFEAPEPFQLTGSGTVKLNWDNLAASRAQVKGEIFWNGKVRAYSHNKPLGKLLGMAG